MSYPRKEFNEFPFIKKSEHIISWGCYDIYDDGRIWSNNHFQDNEFGNQFLKGCFNEHGYLSIGISIKGKRKAFYTHRLVATAWIPNPNNLPFVHHINGIKDDNRVKNLEWGNHQDNLIRSQNNWDAYCRLDNKEFISIAEALNKKNWSYASAKYLIRKGRLEILNKNNKLYKFQEQWNKEKHLWHWASSRWKPNKRV